MLTLVIPALAATVDLGAGARRVPSDYDASTTGLQALVRLTPVPRLGLELGVTARRPSDEVSSLASTLAEVAYTWQITTFRLPVDRELAALSLLATASPWERRTEGLSAWVYGAVGVDLRLVRSDTLSLNVDYYGTSSTITVVERGPTSLGVSPTAGLGFDLWFNGRFGMRFLVLGRVSLEEEPDYDGVTPSGDPAPPGLELTTSRASSINVLVHL